MAEKAAEQKPVEDNVGTVDKQNDANRADDGAVIYH